MAIKGSYDLKLASYNEEKKLANFINQFQR